MVQWSGRRRKGHTCKWMVPFGCPLPCLQLGQVTFTIIAKRQHDVNFGASICPCGLVSLVVHLWKKVFYVAVSFIYAIRWLDLSVLAHLSMHVMGKYGGMGNLAKC